MKILEILGSFAPLARPRGPRSAPLRSSPAQPAVPVAGRQAGLRTPGPPAGTPAVPRNCEGSLRNYEDFNWIAIGCSHDFLGFL